VFLQCIAGKSDTRLSDRNTTEDWRSHDSRKSNTKAAVTRSAQNKLWNNALLFLFHALLCGADTLENTTKARSDLNTQNTTWRNAKYDASRTNDVTSAWPYLFLVHLYVDLIYFKCLMNVSFWSVRFDPVDRLIESRSLGPPSLCWPYFLGSTSDVAWTWLDWRKHDCF
jgi:hypothetical protein